jgi:hypothetical protein
MLFGNDGRLAVATGIASFAKVSPPAQRQRVALGRRGSSAPSRWGVTFCVHYFEVMRNGVLSGLDVEKPVGQFVRSQKAGQQDQRSRCDGEGPHGCNHRVRENFNCILSSPVKQ